MNAIVDEHKQHAVFAPSSAHRWTVCTASAEAIAALGEQEEGDAAKKGTAAHEELERVLRGGALDLDHPSAYGVALVVDFLRQLPPGKIWIEERVALTEHIWGRTDLNHYHEESQTLTVLDLKDGFVDVSPVENEQERIYGAASISTHRLRVKWVRYVIVQPNSIVPGPRVKQWMESADSLYAWASKVAAIPLGPKSFVAGESCTYCPLFGLCPASKDLLVNIGALIAGLMQPEDVTPAQRAIFKACEKPIKDAFSKADKAWTKDALSGNVPPGMKMVTSVKHRAWLNDAWAREFVVNKFGVDALDPPTPAQVLKLGATPEEIDGLVDKPEGGPVLAFESDKRKPWVARSAAEMFAGVINAPAA